jgi:hypothetical protein
MNEPILRLPEGLLEQHPEWEEHLLQLDDKQLESLPKTDYIILMGEEQP